jgi:selenocysteine lyase/cysteine desulfurase
MYIWSRVRMGISIYLDTARLGQMCRKAQVADRDFARLGSEEGCSLYFERFLRLGYDYLPRSDRRCFKGLSDWSGVASLKVRLKRLLEIPQERKALLANRSAQLVQLAARLLCHRCENILVTDMFWPAYLEILAAECRRTSTSITTVPLRQAILRDGVSPRELIDILVSQYYSKHCDGLFLSAVTFEGIRIPVRHVVQSVNASRPPCFVVVDAAQALNHAPLRLDREYCDFLVAGSHKWLRAYQPMGFGFCCRQHSEPWIVDTCRRMMADRQLDDPLLHFTEQLESDTVEAFSETVNVAPMFTATAAAGQALTTGLCKRVEFRVQRRNADQLALGARRAGWRLLRPKSKLRTGILLLEARRQSTREAPVDRIRSAFRRAGVALTAYDGGIIRASFLARPLKATHLDRIRRALQKCA